MNASVTHTGGAIGGTRSAIVLGGGVVGVTTALFLRRRGYEVTLIERNGDVGQGTSHANGGLVSVGCSAPWNSPSTPGTVLRSWGRADSPFLFRAAAFPTIVPWAMRYLLQCRADRYHRASAASVALLAYSLDQLRQVVSEVPIRYDRLQNGVMKLFGDRSQLDAELARSRTLTESGLKFQHLTADEVIDLEPTIASQRPTLVGAVYYPEDESGDAFKYTKGIADACRQIGVKFELNCDLHDLSIASNRIENVVTSRGAFKADQYVLALGALDRLLRRRTGLTLPIYPVKGYSVTIEAGADVVLPKVPFVDWSRKISMTAFGTRLRIAGTAEFGGTIRS